MTKNVVQRLQTIQQDLTSIISIYDLTSKPRKNDETESQKKQKTVEHPEMDASKVSDSANLRNQIKYMSTLLSPVKNNDSFDSGSTRGRNSDESMLVSSGALQKPGSAPAPSGIARQSENVWRPSSGSSSNTGERWDLLKATASDSFCQTLWYDCPSTTEWEEVKAPKNISVKNNYEEKEERKESKLPLPISTSKVGAMRREECKTSEKQNSDSAKTIIVSRREKQDHSLVSGGSRSFSQRKESPNRYEFYDSNLMTSISSATTKTFQILKKDKPAERSTKGATKLPMAKQRSLSPEVKQKNAQIGKFGSSKTNKDDEDTKDNSTSSSKPSERAVSRGKQEEKNFGDKSDGEKKLRGPCSNQKPPKSAGEEDAEVGTKEYPVVSSNCKEKLEKMKSSKDAALNIAKQLKDKYEELRHSKEELLEQYQKIERENKRLTSEIKAAESSKKRIQIKFEDLKNESKTKLAEQEIRTKQVEEENGRLKNKMSEMVKQHNEELIQKQKEIEHLQNERLHEVRNVLKVREKGKGQIQRLNSEKTDLQAKIKELRDLLNKNHIKTEKLEKENRRLQELQSHIQDNKKKKETGEDANCELEAIRQNSKDLEEQVKMLRKSVETFDEVQQKLIKQTMDYQEQMQAGLEEIEKLKSENSKLSKELENEKDALLIKIKIIEDQQETIKQLKEKSEEVKTLVKKNQSLERILNIEREEKLELEEAVEHLNRRKDELKKKIRYLENNLLLAPQEVVQDLQKTQVVLHELESQVQAKQKEWEFHLQSLIKQKERACSVAEWVANILNRISLENTIKQIKDAFLDKNVDVKDKHAKDKQNQYKRLDQPAELLPKTGNLIS